MFGMYPFDLSTNFPKDVLIDNVKHNALNHSENQLRDAAT